MTGTTALLQEVKSRMPRLVSTDALFARPSWLAGAALNLDLWGTFKSHNYSASDEEADEKALGADWIIVGYDFWNALLNPGSRRSFVQGQLFDTRRYEQ